MVILMSAGATRDQLNTVLGRLRDLGCSARVDPGPPAVIVVHGATAQVDEGTLHLPGVHRIRRLTAPYVHARRSEGGPDSRIDVSGVTFGGSELVIIAGPCAVEDRSSTLDVARQVRERGARMLRGGAFKPRRSPYSFQGLGDEGLEILAEARRVTGLPIVTEITSERHLDAFERIGVDLYQVGTRNMFNYELLRELGRLGKPVLLKRGFSATVEEFLLAAEYVLDAGNPRVILCERGIRTFEPAYRFLLDLNGVAYLRDRTHLPVVVDPSHGTGDRRLVTRLAMAAVAAGAQGLLIEVHPDPGEARSDAPQQLVPETFGLLVDGVNALWTHLRAEAATPV